MSTNPKKFAETPAHRAAAWALRPAKTVKSIDQDLVCEARSRNYHVLARRRRRRCCGRAYSRARCYGANPREWLSVSRLNHGSALGSPRRSRATVVPWGVLDTHLQITIDDDGPPSGAVAAAGWLHLQYVK